MKIGGLFFGYGGLDLAVQSVIPSAQLAWYSEFDKGANKIAAHRFPSVPNHGDITKIDWSSVEPIDILTGGSPCQDLSHAGRRAGMIEGTRSNLWVAMREAIAQLRPSLVVWENVRGAYSAAADSAVEPCPGCVGDGSGVHLRALGRVLGDLSDLGYDASWHGLRAADVGAPHGRFRVFVVAQDAQCEGRRAAWHAAPGQAAGWRASAVASRPGGMAADGEDGLTLLPTPAGNDMGASYTPETWDEWTAKMQAAHGNGNGHGKSLSIEAQRLLPTPTSADAKASGAAGYGGNEFCTLTDATVRGRGHMDRPHDTNQWGDYAAAIHRWESLTRPAPAPTETSPKGNPRLAAAFSEWMMGLPAGWVTDVPGITRNEALKALGNGVVPQQAAAALREMFAWEVAA